MRQFSDSNALDTESACDIDCYEIDDLEVLDARIKDRDDLYSTDGRTVLLITSEMERSESYSLRISGIYDEFGNEMKSSSSNKTYRFKGLGEDRTPPYIIAVQCIDSRTLELNFDNELDEESAENIINYRIDGLALVTKAVLQEDGKSVRLTVSSLSSDRNHTVMMNNIKDLSGNSLRNVEIDILYNGSLYDDDPPEVDYIDAVNEEEVWIYFEEEVYAENAEMKASGISFRQVGSVLEDGTAVVMKASELMEDDEYEVTKLTGIWDLRNNPYEFEDGLEFYGTDNENDPPEVDYWDQMDVRRFRVEFTEPVLLKGDGVSGIKNPGGISINWTAVLNPDEEDTEEAYCTVDYIAVNKNIPSDKEFKFNFTAMVSDYVGLGAYDEDDDGPGDSGSTILDSYMEDDEEPYIEYVEAITCKKVQVVFSEAIREPGRYKITYDDDDGRLRTIDIEFVEVDSEDNERVNIFTEDEMSDEYYYILEPQSAALDIAGNKLDIDDLEIDFDGSSIMSSDYVQDVELLNSNTFRVIKSSRIYKVSSLYELDEDGNTIGENLIGSVSRVSSNVYKVVSKKPLFRDVRYKITVDGLSYKFYGGTAKADYEPELPDYSSSKEIASFSFKNIGGGIVGSIDEDDRIIRLTVPYDTDVKHLAASFKCSEHAVVKVGSVTQVSGETINDFSKVVDYTVIAQDGTTREYTVVVKRTPSSENLITAFAFRALDPVVKAEVGQEQETIELTVPYGTDRTKLIASFRVSPEAAVKVEGEEQISGETEKDFTNPVKYIVTAQDGTTREYTVIVTVAPNSEKLMKVFGFAVPKAEGIVDEAYKSISVKVPYGTAVNQLVAVFSSSEDSKVRIGNDEQKSGETIRDFTNPVIYTVAAQDGSAQDYTVTVTAAVYDEKKLTAFSFNVNNAIINATIDEVNHIVYAEVPAGTVLKRLTANFTYIGKSVYVGEVQQYSGITVNDFRRKVFYRVTAFDDSYVDYEVIVKKPAGEA
jgi:hypothetical protein